MPVAWPSTATWLQRWSGSGRSLGRGDQLEPSAGTGTLISLLVALWGAALLGKAVLERNGMVRHPATWTCS